ncbi:hypothetical protein [Tessaracoccus sp. G1721]
MDDTAAAGGAARRVPVWELGVGGAVAGLYLALGRLDRAIGESDAQAGASLMATVSGPRWPLPLPGAESRPWATLFALDDAAGPGIWAFTVVDSAMAVLYGLLLPRLLRARVSRPGEGPPSPLRLITTPQPRIAWVAAGADLTENALLLAVFLTGRDGGRMSGGLAAVTSLVTFVKWGALVLAVVPLLAAAVAWGRRRTR